MIINSHEEYDSESIRAEAKWESLARQKAFAVGIMAIVWAGGELPPAMIRESKRIRRQMTKNNTWKIA